jgi:hypothetical protein
MNNQNAALTEQKSIGLCIFLSILTFGIYYIIWLAGMCKKIKLMNGEEPSVAGEVILCLIIPFYSLYWLYSRSKKLASAAANRGISLDDRAVINLVLAIFGLAIVSFALIQSDLNKAATALAGTTV